MIRGSISESSFLGLEAADRPLVVELVRRLNAKWNRNQLRRRYYEGHNALKDLGISIPPQLKSVEVAVGLPAKAVDAMVDRNQLQGFVSTSGSAAMDALLADLWESNRLAVEIPAGHTSALIHSCAFVFLSRGVVSEGDPEVVISIKSAEDASAIWDARRRRVLAALSVDDRDRDTGDPTLMHVYLPPADGRPGKVMRIMRGVGALEAVQVAEFAGSVPVEVLPYQPSLTRPFGRSRITRTVMYLTDAAMRTMLRTEVGAEFFNAPQRYALGADEDAFTDPDGNAVPAWQVMLGRLLTLTRDEETGELPQVGQFAQQSMVPNIDHLRSIAQMFAAEASLDVGSLGIVQDNPSSAEAIRARHEELGIKIENWRTSVLSPTWKRVLGRSAMMVDGSAALAGEVSAISPQWGSWSAPSEVSQAQASLARVQAVPRLAETDVELERMGFTADEIKRIRADWRRGEGSATLAALRAAAEQQQGPASVGA